MRNQTRPPILPWATKRKREGKSRSENKFRLREGGKGHAVELEGREAVIGVEVGRGPGIGGGDEGRERGAEEEKG